MQEDDVPVELQAPEGELATSNEKSEADPKPEGEEAAKTGTEEDADPEADEAEGEGEDDDKPKRKSRSGSQRLKRENQALRAELDAYRSHTQRDDGAALASALEREIGAPPKESDYPDFFEFERAKTVYETSKALVSRELRQKSHQAESAYAQRMSDVVEDFKERVSEAKKAIPDFDQVVAKAASIKVTPIVESLVLESDKGALLQYHFAKNPADLQRINALPPLQAAKEIGRLERGLSLPNPNRKTSAPPPQSSPRGSAAPSSAEADLNAWLKKTYG